MAAVSSTFARAPGLVRVMRRCFVGLVGSSVLLLGVVLTVLPVPSLLVIVAGLGLLSLEFVWAARWLGRVHTAAAWLRMQLTGQATRMMAVAVGR